MCWFAWGVSTSLGRPAPAPGLGWLPGSFSVHADGEPARLPVYRRAVEDEAIPPGWAADDGVGLLFRRRALVEAVSSRPGARALRIEPGGEAALVPRRLARLDRAGPPPEIAELRRVRALRPG
jgi:hypothetical protein